MMPSVSYDSSVGITCKESHVALCFNHLDLENKRVPLPMPSVSCNAHTGANNITRSSHTLFPLSSPNEQYSVIDDAVSMTQQQW